MSPVRPRRGNLWKVSAALGAMIIWSDVAYAGESAVEAMRDYQKSNELMKLATKYYIAGLAEGLDWANTHLLKIGQKPLYCLPKKLSLTVEQDVNILSNFVSAHPDIGNLPAGLILEQAMIDTFPCGQ